jgi:hypothetical protein
MRHCQRLDQALDCLGLHAQFNTWRPTKWATPVLVTSRLSLCRSPRPNNSRGQRPGRRNRVLEIRGETTTFEHVFGTTLGWLRVGEKLTVRASEENR